MNSLKQQIKSGSALRSVRQAEAMAGHTASQHYSPGGPRPLACRTRYKALDGARGIRKAAMRAFTPANPFVTGLTPHRHSSARL